MSLPKNIYNLVKKNENYTEIFRNRNINVTLFDVHVVKRVF